MGLKSWSDRAEAAQRLHEHARITRAKRDSRMVFFIAGTPGRQRKERAGRAAPDRANQPIQAVIRRIPADLGNGSSTMAKSWRSRGGAKRVFRADCRVNLAVGHGNRSRVGWGLVHFSAGSRVFGKDVGRKHGPVPLGATGTVPCRDGAWCTFPTSWAPSRNVCTGHGTCLARWNRAPPSYRSRKVIRPLVRS